MGGKKRGEWLGLGIDIGGTKIAAGVVSESGIVLRASRVDTRVQQGRKAVIAQIREMVNRFMVQNALAGIGIGTGGRVDARTGEVVSATPLLPRWKGVNLKRLLEKETGLHVFVDNDVNAAALAEHRFGWGREHHNLVVLSIGTGLGGGIVINGELLRGKKGYGGEIGHMIIVADGRRCNCGKRGCLEAYVSGPALERQARRYRPRYPQSAIFRAVQHQRTRPSAIGARHIIQCARHGDALARRLLTDMVGYLAIGIDDVFTVLDPECVVLSGGIMEGGGTFLLHLVRDSLCRTSEYGAQRARDVVLSRLGRFAGILGAACLVFNSVP
jgi:glucokinase-like ROK family protein